ncbi:MAG: serine/threonine-protein kinase [Planctomycetota bacterium]
MTAGDDQSEGTTRNGADDGTARNTSQLLRAAETLFERALEVDGADARDRWLARATGGDEALLCEVRSLLDAHERSTDFLETSPLLRETDDCEAAVDAAVGDELGPYRIEALLGEGGFGVVYRALQSEPVRRQVALKVIKLGMDTRRVIARFEAERQALALMDHPSIARVIDAGATDSGRPYFVMDLVEGVELTRFCDDERLDVRERCKVFVKLCNAVQHAHQRGLIHRDLKPSNVLASRADGEVQVKVIDFGIAKATTDEVDDAASALRTEQGQVIGTPVYMSPEQAIGRVDIDTRADVYSLGVILYELLAGSTPLSGEELRDRARAGEMASFLANYSPPNPSARLATGEGAESVAQRRRGTLASVRARVRGDLDAIAQRALEGDRDRRYDSAANLGRDVQNALEHRPIEASPPSTAYRIWKFTRRHRIGVAAMSAVVIALVAGGLVAFDSLKAREAQRFELGQIFEYTLDPSVRGDAPIEGETTGYVRRIQGVYGDEAGPILVGGLATIAERLERSGKIDEALVARRLALRHALDSPDDARQIAAARVALGLQLLRVGSVDEGLQELQESVRIDATLGGRPGVYAARLELARAALQAGSAPQAIELASAAESIALQHAPQDLRMRVDALEVLVDVRKQQGDADEALDAWERLIDLLGDLSADSVVVTVRERIRCAEWLASQNDSGGAVFQLHRALGTVRGSNLPRPQLEFEALVELNKIVTRAPSLLPPQAAARELVAELALGRGLFVPGTAEHVAFLRRVASHYELRGRPIEELEILRELFQAVDSRTSSTASRDDPTSPLVDIVRIRTLAALETVTQSDGKIPQEAGDVLRWGLAIARATEPSSDELLAAQIDLELRTGNVLRLFSLTKELEPEESGDADNPFALAWRAATLSAMGTAEKVAEAEELIERARVSLEGAGRYDGGLRRTIEFVDGMVRNARARLSDGR